MKKVRGRMGRCSIVFVVVGVGWGRGLGEEGVWGLCSLGGLCCAWVGGRRGG
jgi:hypothetical protein